MVDRNEAHKTQSDKGLSPLSGPRLRCTDYWFHIGEAHAMRQMFGHTGLSEFVGDVPMYGQGNED